MPKTTSNRLSTKTKPSTTPESSIKSSSSHPEKKTPTTTPAPKIAQNQIPKSSFLMKHSKKKNSSNHPQLSSPIKSTNPNPSVAPKGEIPKEKVDTRNLQRPDLLSRTRTVQRTQTRKFFAIVRKQNALNYTATVLG